MTKLENYIDNVSEHYWLAVDKTRKIASFVNANVTDIPDLIVQIPEIIEEIAGPFFEFIFESLPTRCKVKHGPNPLEKISSVLGQKTCFGSKPPKASTHMTATSAPKAKPTTCRFTPPPRSR